MSLRTKLALTILAVALPLAAGLLWLRSDVRRRSLARGLRGFVHATMQSGGRRHCEEAPASFPLKDDHPRPGQGFEGPRRGPPPHDRPPPDEDGFGRRGPPPRRRAPPPAPRPLPEHRVVLWAYHEDLSASNPAAPAIPDELREGLTAGKASVFDVVHVGGRETIRVAERMPWGAGPCAVVFATQAVPEHLEEDDTIVWGLVALCLGLLLAVLFAAGPVVRRIRRLQAEVGRAAASRYATEVSVEGRDELARLAAAFNDAGRDARLHLEEVEAREETLRRFVADTTHDVMIPLTVLQGHLSDIRRQAERGRVADDDLLRRSMEEAHYLGSLLHNLGAVSKLEGRAANDEFGPVDLNALVERVAERHRPVAKARTVELEYAVPDAPLCARGDVTLLEQAVSNLVHNAVRHNDDGGHVSIVLEAVDGRFRLRVLDDGPGVSETEFLRLTERRFRSNEARTRAPGGLGLGLHIAGDVAERHDFELRFRRLEPHGLEALLEGPAA